MSKGSAPCRTGQPSSDFIQLLERPRSSSAPNSRHYVPGTSAVIPPPLTRSHSGNSIIQSTGGNSMNAADPRNSPVHQQQQSPVSTSPSKTSPPSGITLNTTVQIIQVLVKHGLLFVCTVFFTRFISKELHKSKDTSLLCANSDHLCPECSTAIHTHIGLINHRLRAVSCWLVNEKKSGRDRRAVSIKPTIGQQRTHTTPHLLYDVVVFADYKGQTIAITTTVMLASFAKASPCWL